MVVIDLIEAGGTRMALPEPPDGLTYGNLSLQSLLLNAFPQFFQIGQQALLMRLANGAVLPDAVVAQTQNMHFAMGGRTLHLNA